MEFKDVTGKAYELEDTAKAAFRPSVYACILRKGEVLLIKDEKSGRWEFPGGGLELGEELDEGALREVREETGYRVSVERTPFFIEKEMAYHRRSKAFYHSINFYFFGELAGEERGEQHFAPNEKILDVRFVPVDRLAELDLVAFQKRAVEEFLQQAKK